MLSAHHGLEAGCCCSNPWTGGIRQVPCAPARPLLPTRTAPRKLLGNCCSARGPGPSPQSNAGLSRFSGPAPGTVPQEGLAPGHPLPFACHPSVAAVCLASLQATAVHTEPESRRPSSLHSGASWSYFHQFHMANSKIRTTSCCSLGAEPQAQGGSVHACHLGCLRGGEPRVAPAGQPRGTLVCSEVVVVHARAHMPAP